MVQAFLVFRQFQNVMVVDAFKFGRAMINIVVALPQIEINNIYRYDFFNLRIIHPFIYVVHQ